MSFNHPFSAAQALTPKKSNKLAIVLLVAGILVALSAAAYGYYQQARVEKIVIAIQPIPFGQQITADHLGLIEVPRHRPVQLAGLSDPQTVIGRWAARDIGTNDLLEASDLLDQPPDRPVYPNGEQLGRNMVALPFSTQTIGPLNDRDVVNIGFSDSSGDPALCQSLGGRSVPTSVASIDGVPRPYACRLLSKVNVLYITDTIAYLEVTPYQAHAIWSLQAAGLQLWGERYGASSDALVALDRLDPSQVQGDLLIAPTSTLKLESTIFEPQSAIPGGGAIPGNQLQSETDAGSQLQGESDTGSQP